VRLHGEMEVGRDEGDAVEPQPVADQDEHRDHLAQHAEARRLLARQRLPSGEEAEARVLEQQPFDPEQLGPRHRPAVAPHPQLDEQLPAAGIAMDPQRLAAGVPEVEAEHRPEAELPEPGEEAEPLERELDPLPGVEAEEPLLPPRGAERHAQILEREAPVVLLRSAELAPLERACEAAEAIEGDRLGGRWLEAAAAGEDPGEEPGRVAPGAVAVAAGEEHEQRQRPAAVAGEGEHQPVAREEPVGGELPVAQPVVGRRIAAREVDHEVRTEGGEERRQLPFERREQGGVVDLARERHARGGHRLVVPPGTVVDREGVDGRIVGEEGTGAVAVVEVEIDDEDPAGEAAAAQPAHREGDVVEDAEPLAAIEMRVVEAAAEVAGDAAAGERALGGEDAAAGHRPLGGDELVGLVVAQGQAEDPRERPRSMERFEVGVAVRRPERLPGDGVGHEQQGRMQQALLAEEGEHPLATEGIVQAAGETEGVAGAVDDLGPARAETGAQPPPEPAALARRGRRRGDAGRRFAQRSTTHVAPQPPAVAGASWKVRTRGSRASSARMLSRWTPIPRPWIRRSSRRPAAAAASRAASTTSRTSPGRKPWRSTTSPSSRTTMRSASGRSSGSSSCTVPPRPGGVPPAVSGRA